MASLHAKLMYKLLKKENALRLFIINAEDGFRKGEGILEKLDRSGLSGSFVWKDTPQGHMFWQKIYDKYIAQKNAIISSKSKVLI